jgi:hypothetical protein
MAKPDDINEEDVEQLDDDPATEAKRKGYYFDNHKVEQLLTEYVKGCCTDIGLRDEIMSHAAELIRQIIRTHNFHNVYPGRDPASFGDLFQIAWTQIESTLYKFDWSPGHTKVFNMWSQVSKTVILAHIKKEMRDKKNSDSYKRHLGNKRPRKGVKMERFLTEAREVFKYNEEHLVLLKSLEELYSIDNRPYEGLIGKLVDLSGLQRQKVSEFLKDLRLKGIMFSDAPIHEEKIHRDNRAANQKRGDFEEDEYD